MAQESHIHRGRTPTPSELPTGAEVKAADLIALKALAKPRPTKKPPRVSTQSGQYLSRQRGRGLEFAEVRHYQGGDDIRSIDWRVTARSGKPHTRLYIEERERPVIIACDMRANMQFGTQQRFKSVQAANAAALLAWAALAKGDRVGGIIAAANTHSEIRPSLSHKTLSQFLGLIASNSEISHENNSLSLTQMLAEIRRVTKPGTHVYIISDFHDWNDNCAKQLALISRHNTLDLLLISDRFEQHLPKYGSYPLRSGNQQLMLSSRKHGKLLAESFQQRLKHVSGCAKQYRAGFSHITTADNALDAIELINRGYHRAN